MGTVFILLRFRLRMPSAVPFRNVEPFIVTLAFFALAVALEAATDEVVVSATRREAVKSETALSISTLDSDEIVRIGADHPSEALNRNAGVLIHRGNGQEHLTAIRSPVLTGGAGAGSFLFLEDGVPLRAPGFANVNELLEAHSEIAERIEIVRGLSGAVYGANAIHGVINVLTRAPSEEPYFLAEASVDTIGRIKARGVYSASIGRSGFLGAVSTLDDPGFRADSGADQQKISLRHDYKGDGASVSTILAGYNLNQETAGFVQGMDAYLDPVLRRSNENPNAFRDAKGIRLLSRVDLDIGEGTTLSLTPFARWNDMRFRLHFFPSQAIETNSHWSVGAQNAFYLDRGVMSAIIGVDLDYTEGDLTEFQSIPTIFSYTQGLHYDYAVKAFSASPFISLSLDLTQRLEATVAGRFDYARYVYDNRTASGVVGRFLRPDDRADEYSTFSPKLSLIYDMGDANVYASYARGARPPQTADLYRLQINQTDDPAEAETIDAFEMGAKGVLGAVSYDVAGYYMWKRNFFFRDADGFNVNNGRTRHLGAEAEVTAALPAGFSLDGNASYGRHTYRFNRVITNAAQASEAISSGDDVDTAPRWLAGLRGRWARENFPLTVELEWFYVGRYFTDAANSATYPGHSLVHLRGDLRISERLTANFALRNVFDKAYAERADFAFGSERYFPGEGRVASFGLRIE